MTRDEAVARIQLGLGFRGDQDSNIVLALREAQRLLERGRTLPYFLLQEDQSLAVPAGNAEVPLPERFLREFQDEPLRFTTSLNELVGLEKLSLEVALKRLATADAGQPRAYVLRKDTLAIFPARDVPYSLDWSYYRGALILDSNIENEWLEEEHGAPEVLIARAGMTMAEDLKNPEAYAKFERRYGIAWNGMLADTITRQDEGRPLVMGSRL